MSKDNQNPSAGIAIIHIIEPLGAAWKIRHAPLYSGLLRNGNVTPVEVLLREGPQGLIFYDETRSTGVFAITSSM